MTERTMPDWLDYRDDEKYIDALRTYAQATDAELQQAQAEIKRLNDWIDGFTDRHLTERRLGDAVIKEFQQRAEQAEQRVKELEKSAERAATDAEKLIESGRFNGRNIYEWQRACIESEQRADGLENELARLENGSECCPRGNYLQSKKQAAEAQADDLARQLAEVAAERDALAKWYIRFRTWFHYSKSLGSPWGNTEGSWAEKLDDYQKAIDGAMKPKGDSNA